jgi:hypothetical protein
MNEKFTQVLDFERAKANQLAMNDDNLDGHEIGDLQMS